MLGPNGAGKTTTIRMLATLLRPDAGTARVLGHDIVTEAAAVRGRMSLTGQFASVDEELDGPREPRADRPAARARAGGRAAERAVDLLDAFGLPDAADKLVRDYSGGMRRRLDIAASIVVTPELLFLDEPTTGLDPRSRNQVWDIVRVLVAEGATVLLTTQYLDEADQLADRLAIIDHGRVIAEGTRGELKASVGAGIAARPRRRDPDQRSPPSRCWPRPSACRCSSTPIPPRCRPPTSTPIAPPAPWPRWPRPASPSPSSPLGQPSLDEVFLALTGHPAEPRRRQDDQEDAA